MNLAFVHSPDAPLAEALDAGHHVIVLLHGYGADERDLAGLATYLPRGLPWVSVRAPLRHPSFGYSWYPLDEIASPLEAPAIDAATAALWEFIDDTLHEDARLIPVGFSQGGLMASQLLRTRVERVAAAAILSGYVQPSPQPADAVLADSPRPVFWGRGTADLVIPSHAVDITRAFLPGHSMLTERTYPNLPHSVNEDELADLATFLRGVIA